MKGPKESKEWNKDDGTSSKDKNGLMIAEDVKIKERIKEYFDELLNFEKEREEIVLAVR